ncbi:hypothetical protein [Acidiphilium sp. 37-64-53]|uniref:hypothetical protein n=1 Tax=Acidiphilium sp. 37-64-53 TaxID=1970299 RepID=UPI00257A3B05|nr:hypothetical protein [Acidiphilium sp. 37-64-53]
MRFIPQQIAAQTAILPGDRRMNFVVGPEYVAGTEGAPSDPGKSTGPLHHGIRSQVTIIGTLNGRPVLPFGGNPARSSAECSTSGDFVQPQG